MGEEHLQALYDKLRLKLGKCLERNNTAFVIGGSKDMFKEICQVYKDGVQKSKILIISSADREGPTFKNAF